MRIVILATEPSGDFLGAKLIKNLKKNIFIGKKYILRLRPCCLNLVKKKLIFFLKGFIEENGSTGE